MWQKQNTTTPDTAPFIIEDAENKRDPEKFGIINMDFILGHCEKGLRLNLVKP